MKKTYIKPLIEIEAYELNASIAANCGSVISFGPELGGNEPCKEFEDAFEIHAVVPGIGIMSTGGKPFYDAEGITCDCYYQSGGGIYFTS